jgi:hypothetical protein
MLWSTKESRDKWKDIAHIVATLAVPIWLAIGSWYIQSSIANITIKKEYVQIALDILRTTKADDEDAENLREWSFETVNRFAPVHLSQAAANELVQYPKEVLVQGRRVETRGPLFYSVESTAIDACAEYYVLTGDTEGMEKCLAAYREQEKKP